MHVLFAFFGDLKRDRVGVNSDIQTGICKAEKATILRLPYDENGGSKSDLFPMCVKFGGASPL